MYLTGCVRCTLIWLSFSLFHVHLGSADSADDGWISVPNNVYLCQGETAVLIWEYDESRLGQADSVCIQKLDLANRNSIPCLSWGKDTGLETSDRVSPLGNAGMYMDDLQVSDSGTYISFVQFTRRVNLTSHANLTVYQDSAPNCAEPDLLTTTPALIKENAPFSVWIIFGTLAIGLVMTLVCACKGRALIKRMCRTHEDGNDNRKNEKMILLNDANKAEQSTSFNDEISATKFTPRDDNSPQGRFIDRVMKMQKNSIRVDLINREDLTRRMLNITCHFAKLAIILLVNARDENYEKRSPNTIRGRAEETVPLEEIFTPRIVNTTGSTKMLKTVVIVGPAGIGKTTMSCYICQQWADGKLWADKYKFLYLFRCREICELYPDDTQTSLFHILMKHYDFVDREHEIMTYLSNNKSEVLFIIDGLDEYNDWCKRAQTQLFEIPKDEREESNACNIINGLITGKLFTGCDVIVTLRPIKEMDCMALSKYNAFSILGFDNKSVEECLKSISSTDPIYITLTNHLKSHPVLRTLCAIPFFCVLYGAIGRPHIEDTGKFHARNMTDMLIYTARYLLMKRDLEDDQKDIILAEEEKGHVIQLTKLAHEFTHSRNNLKLIFGSADLQKYGIGETLLRRFGVLEYYRKNDQMQNELSKSKNEAIYSFLHAMIQEFFTAVCVCLHWKNNNWKQFANIDSLDKEFVNVTLFISGLLCDYNEPAKSLGHGFLSELDKNVDYSVIKKEWIKEVLNNIKDFPSSRTKMRAMRVLHEGQFTDAIESASRGIVSESGQLQVKNCPGGLRSNHMASIGCFLQKAKNVQSLVLRYNLITPDAVDTLLSNMGHSDVWNRITHIDLNVNALHDEGLEKLTKHPVSISMGQHLKHLSLSKNGLTDNAMDYMRTFLSNARELVTLDLSHNIIGDSGVDKISNWLRKCQNLKILSLGYNTIQGYWADNFQEAVANMTSASAINLSGNNIHEQKMIEFLEALAVKTNRKLSIWIRDNDIEEESELHSFNKPNLEIVWTEFVMQKTSKML